MGLQPETKTHPQSHVSYNPQKVETDGRCEKDTESDAETVLYDAPASIDDEPVPEPDTSDVSNKKGKFLTKTFSVKKHLLFGAV